MKAIRALRRLMRNSDRAPEIAEGINNLAELQNRKLEELIGATTSVSERLDRLREGVILKLDALIELQKAQLVMQRDQADAAETLAGAVEQLTKAMSRL
jgi:hypothetical protein